MSDAFDPMVFEEHPAVMLLVNPGDGTIVASNRAATAFYGYSEEEFRGKRIVELNALPPAEVAAAMGRARKGASQVFHFPHRLADGSQRWVEVRSGPVTIKGRELLHSIIIDETARVEAERALERRTQQANLLSASRGWLMRAQDEREVFEALCTVAVRTGGLAEAVVTRLDEFGTRRVVNRERRSDLLHDHAGDAASTACRATYPLRQEDVAIAELTLLVLDAAALDDEMLRTLGELAEDASYALTVLADRRRHAAGARQLELKARAAQVLLDLPALAAGLSEQEFLQHGLDELESLTGSAISFVHNVDEHTESIELVTWSRGTLAHYCHAVHDSHYPIRDAGIWADAYRQRIPVIVNDYANHPAPHGLPTGHAHLVRFMSIPVIENGAVRMLTGVGNKATDYTADEVEAVRLISEELWRLSQRERLSRAREAERRFQETLVDTLGEAVISCDADGRVTMFNAHAQHWYGEALQKGMLLDHWVQTFGLREADGTRPLPPEQATLRRALNGEYFNDVRVQLAPRGLPVRQLRVRGGPLLDAMGHTIGAIIVMRDCTAEEAAEASLRLRSAALEAAADAVIITDLHGRIEWANAAFTTMSGYTLDEVLQREPRELVHSGLNEPSVYARLWRTILAGEVWSGELVNRRKDGTTYPEWMTITPVRDGQGVLRHFVALKRDLTENTLLRNSLLQSQKMEVVGRLAGGIAHDFNNLLTVIHGSAALAASQLPADSDAAADLVDVQQAALRASSLTRQLLAFSRRQVMRREMLDLNRVVTELSRMLSRLIGEDIAVRLELRADAWKTLGDAGQLEQAILNLVVNARDAMPQGGTLWIATDNVTVSAADAARLGEIAPGEYVMLVVRDSGTGMTDEVRDHLFEPFFTTKAQGKGTGLGLSTVYGIVRQSAGAIDVDTVLGQGSAFRLYFPRSEEAEPSSMPRVPQGVVAPGHGTIVLVDDEPVLRKVAVRILTRAGYTALEASDAAEAEMLVRERDGHVDLLITDVVMPDMSGPELVERLTAVYPQLLVLYTSGYTSDSTAVESVHRDAAHFLPKPYTIESLTQEVARVLALRRAGADQGAMTS